MRKILQLLLLRPIRWMVDRYSSRPDRGRIFEALSRLKSQIETDAGKKGFVIPFDPAKNKFIIFSDQHKGRKNGADDFAPAEQTYLEALHYYNRETFHLIALGDCEELWENTMLQVIKANSLSFDAEAKFLQRQAFTKIFGNHDLDWEIDPLAQSYLKEIYKEKIVVLEAVTLQTNTDDGLLTIFCTHGHQGDLQSDGNWFSKFLISKIWAPLQAYLRINPNTPAYDRELKSLHNTIMYEWSATQKELILITGHTHQPVFESLTHTERLMRKKQSALAASNPEWAKAIADEIEWRKKTEGEIPSDYLKIRPSYFNTGCCCYSDGDITGIEIADGYIRLIKWKMKDGKASRMVLEESTLRSVQRALALERSA
ncbi:MAG TPA: metallophosphoesterase [Chryseosolibacter sp.]